VDDFMAEAKPEDKLYRIREEQANGHLVGMIAMALMTRPLWPRQMWAWQ